MADQISIQQDSSTSFGLIAAFIIIGLAIVISADKISMYLDMPSALIVCGATFFLCIACYTVSEVWQAFGIAWRALLSETPNLQQTIFTLLELAEISRKQSILELQKHENRIQDRFFIDGLRHVIDGTAPKDIEPLLSHRIAAMVEQRKHASAILRKFAEIAPAMGLIGTLIGLVQMLSNLSDPTAIGPGMAVALITTLYGAMLAFMVFLPIASKIERNAKEETLLMEIYLEALLSMARKENPRKLEHIINALLPADKRVKHFG